MSVIRFDNTKSGTAHDLVEKISREVPRSVQIDVLMETYPNGKVRGHDFLLGSLALFTVMNKDTSEIYYELVPFDKELAQRTSDRGVEILQATKAKEMLPRIAANKDYFACKWCEFKETGS